MVPPEDIEKMAQAVLDIQLPRPPDQIRSMINDINKLLSTTHNPPKTLEHTKTAQTLLQEAQKLKSVSETNQRTQSLTHFNQNYHENT